MSLKVQTFSQIIQHPKTAEKFCVYIPSYPNSLFTVSSTNMPFEEIKESVYYVQGQPVFFPTRSQVPGEWSCIIDENKSMISGIGAGLTSRMVRDFNFKSQDIIVMLLDQESGTVPVWVCVLRHCWLKSRKPLSLDWSKPETPLKWELSFRYNSILTGTTVLQAFAPFLANLINANV